MKERYFVKKDFRTAQPWLFTSDERFKETNTALYLGGGLTGRNYEWIPKTNLIEVEGHVDHDLRDLLKTWTIDETYSKEELSDSIEAVLKDAGISLNK